MGVMDAGLCYKNHVTENMTWQGVAGVGRKRRDTGCSLPGVIPAWFISTVRAQ